MAGHEVRDLLEKVDRMSRQIKLLEESLEIEREHSKNIESKYNELKEQFRLLRQAYFGRRTEKLSDPNQLWLWKEEEIKDTQTVELPTKEDEEGDKPGNKNKNKKERSTRGIRKTRELSVVVEELIPDVVKNNPEDYEKFDETVTEKLEYKKAEIWILKTVRPRFKLRADRHAAPLQHPAPVCLLEGGYIGNSVVLETLIGKYIDHQPLYRLSKNWFNRLGVDIPRNTLCHAVEKAAELLTVIYEDIRKHIFSGGYVQIDETRVRYLRKSVKGSKVGYVWAAHSPGRGTYYKWGPGRNHEVLDKLIPPEFEGIIQSDGYSVYEKIIKERTGISLLSCTAHIRRKFIQSDKSSPRESLWYVKKFGQLYEIEKHLRNDESTPEERMAIRKQRSLPIYNEIRERLDTDLKDSEKKYSPRNSFVTALKYADKRWSSMGKYIENGLLEIDNNLVENKIRPLALGRKNWLFIGSEVAGDRSAIIYTIIETCRDLGILPDDYLKDLLDELPKRTNQNYHDLLPWEWKKRQNKAPELETAE